MLSINHEMTMKKYLIEALQKERYQILFENCNFNTIRGIYTLKHMHGLNLHKTISNYPYGFNFFLSLGYFTFKIQLSFKYYSTQYTYVTRSIKPGTYKGTVHQDFEDLVKHNDKGRHCCRAVRGICRSIYDNDDGAPLSGSKSQSPFLWSNNQKYSSFYFSGGLD